MPQIPARIPTVIEIGSLLLISGTAGGRAATIKIGLEEADADAVADVLLE